MWPEVLHPDQCICYWNNHHWRIKGSDCGIKDDPQSNLQKPPLHLQLENIHPWSAHRSTIGESLQIQLFHYIFRLGAGFHLGRFCGRLSASTNKKYKFFQVFTNFNQVFAKFNQVSTSFSQVSTKLNQVFAKFNQVSPILIKFNHLKESVSSILIKFNQL